MNFNAHPMFDWLSGLRREFHRHPEVSLQEHDTTARIKQILTGLGVEILPLETATGAAGLIAGTKAGNTLGIRADIDALPMSEENQTAYCSQNPGVMHSCGHDAHSAILLGVAKKVMETGLPARMKGNLKLIFQPAEEIGAGARTMIEAGVMQNPAVERILACHVWTDLKVGQIGLYRGVSHAFTDQFELRIKGRGVHGSSPHKGIDPIPAGAALVAGVQAIVSRNVPPTKTAVISVGKFQAGTAGNIIAGEALLEGTIRTLEASVRDLVLERLQALTRSLEPAFGVEVDFSLRRGVPACHNDPLVSAALFEAARPVVGEKNIFWLEPGTGGEDFALFTRLVPGCMMRLGTGNPDRGITSPHHSGTFDIDEAALPIGVEIFYRALKDYLE